MEKTNSSQTELTERQIRILKAIIDDYIISGNPIGSDFLEKKFKLGYSPATIRNEMVTLGKLGYIEKAHFSAGRIPTPKAFRIYITSLLPKKELSTADEVSLKNEVWDYQNDTVRFLEETTKVLANKSGLLSLLVLNSGFRYYTGVENLLVLKEFLGQELGASLFGYVDNYTYWLKILDELFVKDLHLQVLLGEDYLYEPLYNLGGVFSPIESKNLKGVIGVIGPCRLEYALALPLVNYTAEIVNEVLNKKNA